MTTEQCRTKVAALLEEAERIELADSKAAFRAQASYLLEWAHEMDGLRLTSPTTH